MSTKVEIYTSPFCGYCHRAKRLLAERGVDFVEIDLMAEPGRRVEMRERSGGRFTLPQIFIDGRHVGDCEELYALDRAGRLAGLLVQSP
jgi:glutaredoxin 3